MPSEIALHVDGISKSYEVFRTPAQRLAQLLVPSLRLGRRFDALKPLSFQVRRGGFFGIIGQNGSGKSTLLQIVSGILTPTSGRLAVSGRIGALLELGAGFNPEFTGRENARLNASILGLSSAEFERVLPEIEAFADIGEFIDQPVKTYSSGMFVRLAFAVQACIDPEVLIIDEALAVGDIFFRLKCYERLDRLRKSGCTVILVTHSMEDIMHYCDQVLLLHRGEALFCGDPVEAVNRYYALGHLAPVQPSDAENPLAAPIAEDGGEGGGADIGWPGLPLIALADRSVVEDGAVRCAGFVVTDAHGRPRHVFRQGEVALVWVEYQVLRALETPAAGFVVRTEKGVVVHGRHSGQAASTVPRVVAAGRRVRVVHRIPIEIGPGEYVIDLGFASWPNSVYDNQRQVTMAELEATSRRHCVVTAAVSFSVIPSGDIGFAAQPFYGLVGLHSSSRLQVGAGDGGPADAERRAGDGEDGDRRDGDSERPVGGP